MELVIVESPNKAKKIKQILGAGYEVQASVGHIADLPKKEMGVQAPEFEPDFQLTERGKETVSKLKGVVKNASKVWLATDPDREGEAIASHLAHFLKLKNSQRIVFNEITNRAVKAALNDAREVDQSLYAAQKARRVVDRLTGYLVSPKLSQIASQTLSAGRVQSVALRLVVERERVIRNFKATDHFGVKLLLHSHSCNWVVHWLTDAYVDADNPYVLDRALAEEVATTSQIEVLNSQKKLQKKNPPPPFITTTLQKAGNLALGLDASETMRVAQKLFESGMITYHRTDNPNLSDDALPMLKSTLVNLGYEDDISTKKNTYKAKANAQEAHEAIRPSDFSKDGEGLEDNERKLYQLIRLRALASQMKSAQIENTTITVKGQTVVQSIHPLFVAKNSEVLYPGWMKLTEKDESDENNETDEKPVRLPEVNQGDEAPVRNRKVLELKTKAPSRYTEPSLISKLEKEGIGRPATYASILSNIKRRGYLQQKGKVFIPSSSADLIVDTLVGKFSFMELGYTKDMEQELDEVAGGNKDYVTIVKSAYDELMKNMGSISADVPSFPCPKCQADMRRIKGKQGFFWGCSKYSEGCKGTMADVDGKPGSQEVANDSDHSCPECHKALRRLKNKKGKYFWGCSGYQDGCKYLTDDNRGKPVGLFHCPKCQKKLRQLKGPKGLFWGCSGYKENNCRASFPNKRGKPDFSNAA